jgi:hypothetical protein
VRLYGHSAGGRPSERLVEPALNCFARGCYRFRNTTCPESETDPAKMAPDRRPARRLQRARSGGGPPNPRRRKPR